MHFTYFLTIMTPYRAVTQLCPIVSGKPASSLPVYITQWLENMSNQELQRYILQLYNRHLHQ